jgi:predicted O-methyltransferase YrrM
MKFEKAFELARKFRSLTGETEARILYDKVINSPPGDVVEVGSAWGGSTIVLIGAAEVVKKNVISVDPYPEELEGKATNYDYGLCKDLREGFKQNILTGKWKNIIQYNEDISSCIDRIPDKLSVVFIDGCHEFTCVRNEVSLLFPKLISGGAIFVHDILWSSGQRSGIEGEGVWYIQDWLKENNIKHSLVKGTSFLCIEKEDE